MSMSSSVYMLLSEKIKHNLNINVTFMENEKMFQLTLIYKICKSATTLQICTVKHRMLQIFI